MVIPAFRIPNFYIFLFYKNNKATLFNTEFKLISVVINSLLQTSCTPNRA
uniref:Uncharacterized protein n=1 Tax=Arundo donax TaxID=35708 RepID=A0A0A9CRI5_ARUDO